MSGDLRKYDRRRRFGTLFDGPRTGRKGVLLPRLDVPEADPAALYGSLARAEVTGEVEASEVDVVRHFTRLSQLNVAIDTALYSLGSCTMKHNPRINEEIARLSGFNEIAVRCGTDVAGVLARLEEEKILGGVPLRRLAPDEPSWADLLLVAVTEKTRRIDIDRFLDVLMELA